MLRMTTRKQQSGIYAVPRLDNAPNTYTALRGTIKLKRGYMAGLNTTVIA